MYLCSRFERKVSNKNNTGERSEFLGIDSKAKSSLKRGEEGKDN